MADNFNGATTAVFAITLSTTIDKPISVKWQTEDGTGKAGIDYIAANGTVEFLPGETDKQIQVTVFGRSPDSGADDRMFYIKLFPPSDAILGNTLTECTIKVTDDEGTPVTELIVAQGKRGQKGDPGLSAYEQAVNMGFTGTLQDWMNEIADASQAADRAQVSASRAEAAATSASFLGNIFPSPEAGVDPVTGVPNGAYYNVRSAQDDDYIEEYRNISGVPTPTGKAYPSSQAVQFELNGTITPSTSAAWGAVPQIKKLTGDTSIELNAQSKVLLHMLNDVRKNGGAMPYSPEFAMLIGGFDVGDRVKLSSGGILISTIADNMNNPNNDLTGWIADNSAARIFYSQGYSVQASLYYLTPEMFGAKGIGSAFNDYDAIQNMLNAGAEGCVFEFDGSKNYYNGFTIDDPNVFVNHKDGATNSKQWTRRLGATFKFNGCKLTRRAPTGDIEDIPNKTKYSDNDSSSLLIIGANKVKIYDMFADCGGTKRGLVDLSSNPIPNSQDYYGADVGVFGLRLLNCDDVKLSNVNAEKGYFNIFIDSCTNVRGDVQVRGSVQCPIRSYAPNDLNFGGGLKIWFSKNVKLKVYGEYNTNATVECEKGNEDIHVQGSCNNDWSNGVVIQDTIDLKIFWTSKNVKSGTGVFFLRTGEEATPNMNSIQGKIVAKNCYWRGVMIQNNAAATSDLYGIQLEVITESCGDGGLYIKNDSSASIIDGININHHSRNDNGTNKTRCFSGRMRGTVTGQSTGSNYGAIIQGSNTPQTCITLSIDASNCAVPYDVQSSSAYVNFKEFVTANDVITAFAAKNMQLGTTTNGGGYQNQGEVRLNFFAVKFTAQYNVMDNIANNSGSEKGRIWYDPTAGVTVSGGKQYPLKVFIPD